MAQPLRCTPSVNKPAAAIELPAKRKPIESQRKKINPQKNRAHNVSAACNQKVNLLEAKCQTSSNMMRPTFTPTC